MDFFADSVIVSYPSFTSTSSSILSFPSAQSNLSFAMTVPIVSQKDSTVYQELMDKQIAVLYTDKPTLTSVLYKYYK